MKKKLILLFCLFLSNLFVFQTFAGASTCAQLNELIEEALQNNPNIMVAHNLWRAEDYEVPQKRSLPDPVFQYGYFGESIETRVGPQKQKIGGALKVPFLPKLTHRGRSQENNASIYKEKYEALKNDIIRDVKFVYYDIFWVDKATQTTNEEKVIMESLESVAKKRYESDLAPLQDVIKAQVEISNLIDQLYFLKERRSTLVSRLNAVLNRPYDTPFPQIRNIEVQKMPYVKESLHEMAWEERPELAEARFGIEKAEEEKTLAKLDYFPDFTFGFDYTVIGSGTTALPSDGKNAWIGTISINIPIWFNKMRAGINEKNARLKASRRNYQERVNKVNYEVDDAYYKIKLYSDTIDLYKNALVPQTEQAFDAARIAYEAGKVDFLNWLDAERTVLKTRLSYYRAIADYQKAIADIERVVGQGLVSKKRGE